MIGQYQAVYNQFIRNNHREMNQKGYTHTSSPMDQEPTTSTYTDTKRRLGESTNTGQFPKMFNVDRLLTSSQAQCEMAGSQKSEKKTKLMEQFQQFQKRIKQMKRKITKDLEKLSKRYFEDNDEMDQTGSVQIILKEQENIRDRSRKMEIEVENFNFF